MQKPVEVVAAALLREGRILLARRAEGRREGLWELPGGKRRQQETARECLRRELLEELGVEAKIGAHLATSLHSYDDMFIHLSAYLATIVSGHPTARVHSEIRWIPIARVQRYRLSPADKPIARVLVQRCGEADSAGQK